MDAAPTAVVVESMCIATEVSKHVQAPQGGFRSKCNARTRRSSRVADKAGIVFALQVEKCANKAVRVALWVIYDEVPKLVALACTG